MIFFRKLFHKKEKLQYVPKDFSAGKTVYLTKIKNDGLHFYEATVEGWGVKVVQGIANKQATEYWQGCGNWDNAVLKKEELVKQKINEGYVIAQSKETAYSTGGIHDKASWHMSVGTGWEVSDFQGYVPTGMYLGWLIENSFLSEEFIEVNQERITLFKQRQLSGAKIFELGCDGVLSMEDLTETANKFTYSYLDAGKGGYFKDYKETLADNLPTIYHVADTWENYEKIKSIINRRFAEWHQ